MTKRAHRFVKSNLLPLTLVFGTLVAGILIGTVISGPVDAARDTDEPVSDATPLQIPEPQPVDNQFSELARRMRPSVVSIVIPASQPDEEDRDPPSQPEEMFRRFFGFPFDGPPREPRRGPGQGSGVVVDPKGYIITNDHVVRGADRIKVLFMDDEKEYDAELIGTDEETDLAVIRVEGKPGLHAAPIGNSDAVNVGDWAVAIGAPFGYRETVTVGIISAKSREVRGLVDKPFLKFLQTDAAINPGNSGGPLLNIRGEVIGINTAIISRTGGYDGIGFALASNIAVETYNQVIRYGRVARGSIGVHFGREHNLSLLRSYGSETGVFVQSVVEDGPAEAAGMQEEDIIVAVDGIDIENGDKLLQVVSGIAVGKTVPIEVIRAGEPVTLRVTIMDRERLYQEISASRRDTPPDAEESTVKLGVTVRGISPEERQELGMDFDGGVLLTKVASRSFAEEIGLQRGDVIVSMNRIGVNSVRELREIQDSLSPGQNVAVKVMRAGGRQWTPVYLAGVLPDAETLPDAARPSQP